MRLEAPEVPKWDLFTVPARAIGLELPIHIDIAPASSSTAACHFAWQAYTPKLELT
jgi:hypothetical protein